MSHVTCPLFAGILDEERELLIEDYEGALARWCSGCGDHAVLAAAQRLLRSEQLAPEKTVFVSGIGCSSRFPHYMKTYGFHGLHGRALPVATGVKLSRPELDVFVVMGDGDCCSIGAGHWIHALRYNVDMTVLLLDNAIYGLTKNQTSPTTPQGHRSNTHPRGSILPSLNPLTVSLGVTNASFVAQTAEWIPAHLGATLQAAYRHRGFAFVRILQRCPEFTPHLYDGLLKDPASMELLVHDDGVNVSSLETTYPTRSFHDPGDLDRARSLAEDQSRVRLGVFFRDPSRPRYEEISQAPRRTVTERIDRLNEELDRHAV
jgi:2-oxoglutarate/2-oxoacid ferredoxin oxidoreductase subunit beta